MEASPTDILWNLPGRAPPRGLSPWRAGGSPVPPHPPRGSLDEALPELHGQEFWSPQHTHPALGRGLGRAGHLGGGRGWPQGPQER